MTTTAIDQSAGFKRIPDGQERLATESERAEVTLKLSTPPEERVLPNAAASLIATQREAGDHVNRFLLCALVNESSKQMKQRARRAGQDLPMSKIVRALLRSYRLAAIDLDGPLAGSDIDLNRLMFLNRCVLTDELNRLACEKVSYPRAQLGHAVKTGNEESIETPRGELERAVSLKDAL